MTSADEQEADLAKRIPSHASTYQFDQAVVGVQISVNDAHGVQVSLQEGEARGEDEAPSVSMLSLGCCPGSLRWQLSSPRDRGQASPRATLAPWGKGRCLEARLLESQGREQPLHQEELGGEAVGWGDGLRTRILVLIGPNLPHGNYRRAKMQAGLILRALNFQERYQKQAALASSSLWKTQD